MSRQLLDALRRVHIYSGCGNNGICIEIHRHLRCHNHVEKQDAIYKLKKLIEKWPRHSGSPTYPVRAGKLEGWWFGHAEAARRCYVRHHKKGTLWGNNAYAERRVALLKYLIFELEMEECYLSPGPHG